MVQDCLGGVAKASINDINPDQLPAILIVYKIKGSLDIRNVIQGMCIHVHVVPWNSIQGMCIPRQKGML